MTIRTSSLVGPLLGQISPSPAKGPWTGREWEHRRDGRVNGRIPGEPAGVVYGVIGPDDAAGETTVWCKTRDEAVERIIERREHCPHYPEKSFRLAVSVELHQ